MTDVWGIAYNGLKESHPAVARLECEEVSCESRGTLQERVCGNVPGAAGVYVDPAEKAARLLDSERLQLPSGRVEENAAAEARVENSLGLAGKGPLYENLGD